MANQFDTIEMGSMNGRFYDTASHRTSSGSGRHTSHDSERSECDYKSECCCRSLSCWKMFFIVMLLVMLFCGILGVGLGLFIKFGIISFKIDQNRSTITTSTMILSTTSMINEASIPSTFSNFTNDFIFSSIDPVTSEELTTIATKPTSATTTRTTTKPASTTTTRTTTKSTTQTTTKSTSTITTRTTTKSASTSTTRTTTKSVSTITTRATTTTSTSTITPEPCPRILSQPIQTDNLLLLDNTTNFSNYTHYVLEFDTPVDATLALLVFEFQTKSGPWYLDDVSVKRSDGSGSEIIKNGGFENGVFNFLWKYCYPPIPALSPIISQHFCHSGRYCFASRHFYSKQDYLTQNFTIQSNTRYTIELYTFCKGEPVLFNVTISFQ